jgi:hypothetical protein
MRSGLTRSMLPSSPLVPIMKLLRFILLVAVFSLSVALGNFACSQDKGSSKDASSLDASLSASARRTEAMQFHAMAHQGTGLLIPLYQYPANVHTNTAFNRVMDSKRRFSTIPFWVILNPATGPGKDIDANYTKAIDRLQGAGCVVLGYVSTEYGKRDKNLVLADLDRWQKLYPRIQGAFFDEMIYSDMAESAVHQQKLSQAASQKGFWPIVANPGADTPERYFRERVADVIIVHESEKWPEQERIHGNYFGGYSDYPPHSRGILIHSMKQFDSGKVSMMSRYAKWIYVTQDEYRLNDPAAPNPWDELSEHLEATCKLILADQNENR